MKRLLAVIVSTLAAFACTAPPGNNSAITNANKPAETTSTISEAQVIAKEKDAWDAVKNKNPEGFRKIMADNGLYVSHHGVLDPAGIVRETAELELTELSFSDWKVVPIDKDAVVVTYTAHINGRIKGMPLVSSQVRGSTAWVNRNGNWLAIYHQDCEAKPAPSPGTNKPAKPVSSPAATSLPASTSADASANEKIIWDALKNRNFDAFAALLASDSIEVEPGGVYDKSGSVKGVSEMDFSKAVLSDWQSLKIDEDAALVTYMVKGGSIDPSGEHHTTIWVNRDGKWLALFHQGTPVLKELKPVSEKPGSGPSPKSKSPPIKY
ncbi:MAG TPA: nuclear transport factor 2 family protein [Pyrinomonadaceae bacterium]